MESSHATFASDVVYRILQGGPGHVIRVGLL
jgi:hypothetical protein